MIKILKQQTENSYPVYYCETSADLQKLSTFAPVGSIAYENGKQYILNSLREFAALEYSVNLDDIQLPPDVKEYWEAESLEGILEEIGYELDDLYGQTRRIENELGNLGNQIIVHMVNNENDTIIISGMSKTQFTSKVNAGEFINVKIITRSLNSNGGYEYGMPQIYKIDVANNRYYIDFEYYNGDKDGLDLFTTEGWEED